MENIENKKYTARIRFINFDTKNENDRIYPSSLKDEILKQVSNGSIKMFGQCGSDEKFIGDIQHASHIVDNIRYNASENTMVCDMTVLPTPMGEIVKTLIKNRVPLYGAATGYGVVSADGVVKKFELVGVNLTTSPAFGEVCRVHPKSE